MLRYLADSNKLDPELEALRSIPQDKDHHPEGTALEHTIMVVNEAADISRREGLDSFDNAVLRIAAITHDMGKATHTQIQPDGRITAYGHPEAGIVPATNFMQRSKVSDFVIQQVIPLVNLHMAWVGFYMSDITTKSVRKLARKLHPVTFDMLAYVVEADMSGRGGKYFKQGLPARMQQILDVAKTLNDPVDQYPDPILNGEFLMAYFDIGPSPLLGKIKAALYKAQLEGKFHDRASAWHFLQCCVKIQEFDVKEHK